MKIINKFGILLLIFTLASILILTSCTIAFSPFTKGLLFHEIEGGYMVQPMPISTSINGAASKILTTTSIEIPSSYLGKPVVGVQGFSIYPALQNVSIPDSIRQIETGAFGDSVKYNEYGNGLYLGNEDNPYVALMKPKSIGIKSIEIHKDTKVIAQYAFSDCDSIKDVYYNGSIADWFNISFCDNPISGANLYINQELVTEIDVPNSVTKIGDHALCGYSHLSKITIPNTVTSIGDYAFSNCTSLESITLPNSVTSIGFGAFDFCESLKSITLPNSITHIDDAAFISCTSLESINIPNSITRIGYSTFQFCESLKSITIPNSVTTIDETAFSYCTSLKHIYFDGSLYQWEQIEKMNTWNFNTPATEVICTDGVVEIPYRIDAFAQLKGYIGLSSIIIPENFGNIDEWSFSGCTALQSITYEGTVAQWKTIEKSGYWNSGVPATEVKCTDGIVLIRVTSSDNLFIPDYVMGIESVAFLVSSPQSIEVDPKNKYYKSIDGNLYSKDGSVLVKYFVDKQTTSLVIPDFVTVIDDHAFSGCASLTSVIISDSVTSIGNYAFSSSGSLMYITIPKSVISIGARSFDCCNMLISINYEGTIKQWEAIDKGYGWCDLTGPFIVYCTDGQITKNGTVTYK